MVDNKRIIVSLTSYPKRIKGVHTVLDTIWKQTCMPDQVLLYLATEEFPQKKDEIPEELLNLMKTHPFEIRWCDDLKPHKKYFYAMQEYPEDILITIDDDVLYPETMIENLVDSYKKFPYAVSSARVHLMAIDEKKCILPYKYWIKEVDNYVDEPSMQLFATGCSGVLYPPHIFSEMIFDKQTIKETCLYADDLWLKVVQVLSDVPVVAAGKFEELKYYPGSQEVALYKRNINEGENDIQLSKLMCWLDNTKQKNVFLKNLTSKKQGCNLLGVRKLCEAFENERKKRQKKFNDLNERLKQTYEEKSEINAKLKQTYEEKSEINAKLKQTYEEKTEINQRLKNYISNINTLQKTNTKILEDNQALSKELLQKKEERTQLIIELDELKALKHADEIKLQKAEFENETLTHQLVNLGEENDLLNSKIRGLQEDLQKRDLELNDLNRQFFVRANKKIKRFFHGEG